jgi:O-antigen/teichoic acid export membrane protein
MAAISTNFYSLGAAQALSILLGVISYPLLIQQLGFEGMGYVAFCFVLLITLQIFDGGISANLVRVIAGCTQNNTTLFASKMFVTTQSVFLLVGLTSIAISSLCFALSVDGVNQNSSTIYYIISLIVSIKFIQIPAKATAQGNERFKFLAVLNFCFNLARFPVPILIFLIFQPEIVNYFYILLSFVILETIILLNSSFRTVALWGHIRASLISNLFDLSVLLRTLNESRVLWILSVVWVISSQSDKLALKWSVEIDVFGMVMSALALTNLMITFSSLFTQVLIPRLSSILKDKSENEYRETLINTIKLYVVIFLPISLFGCYYVHDILIIWTGSKNLADQFYFFTALIIIGNFIHGLNNFGFIEAVVRDDLANYAKSIIPISLFCSAFSLAGVLIFGYMTIPVMWLITMVFITRKYAWPRLCDNNIRSILRTEFKYVIALLIIPTGIFLIAFGHGLPAAVVTLINCIVLTIYRLRYSGIKV